MSIGIYCSLVKEVNYLLGNPLQLFVNNINNIIFCWYFFGYMYCDLVLDQSVVSVIWWVKNKITLCIKHVHVQQITRNEYELARFFMCQCATTDII